VEAFTTGYVDIDGEMRDRKEPIIIAMIRLQGADSLFLGEVRGLRPDDMRTGLEVEAVWKEERKGSIGDIEYFKPVG
jgi:hypothetical protein